jgi:hypothetical protein
MVKKNEPPSNFEPLQFEPPSNFEALQIIEALQISKSTLERRVREALKVEGLNWNDPPSKFIEVGSILRKKAENDENGKEDFEWIYTKRFKDFIKDKRSYFQKLKDNVSDRIEALQKKNESPSNFEALQLNPLQNEAIQFEPPSTKIESFQKNAPKKIKPETIKMGQKKRWVRLLRNALKFQNIKNEGKESVLKKEIEIKDGIIREQKKELKDRDVKINQLMVSVGQEQGKVGLLMDENTKLKDQLRLKAPIEEK